MNKSKEQEVTPVRCVIYTRKSTDENLDLDFNSLDAQREAGEAYIASQKSQGWICLDRRYDDGGYSGGNTDRPAFQRLMDDVANGEIDCIVVYKIDRLSRSLMDFARIMETLETHKVSVVSVTQQFNTTSSMGRLTLNILLSFAQFEREIISERTRDKIAAARRKGKWTGGPVVMGYKRISDRRGAQLAIEPEEAERVRAIFRMYLEEGSILPTLRKLKALGWKTPIRETSTGKQRGGVDFDTNSLYTILNNVLYLGKVTYKDEIYEGEHEAIIEEDVFARAQGQLRRNRRSGGKHTRNKHGALLKGLVRCKSCGCAMSHHFATRGSKRYRYYVCLRAQKHGWENCPSPSLPAKQLEDFVVDQIKTIGRDRGVLKDALKATQIQLTADVEQLEKQRRKIEEQMKELGRRVGEVSGRAGYDPQATLELQRLQDEIQQLQKKATEINGQMSRIQKRILQPDEMAGALEAFDPLWGAMSPEQQSKLVHLLIQRVEYDSLEETISLAFHPAGIRSLTAETQREETEACLTPIS